MKPKTLVGIVLLTAAIVFSFSSCKDDSDNGHNAKVLSFFKNTVWEDPHGTIYAFSSDSVTITKTDSTQLTFFLEKIWYDNLVSPPVTYLRYYNENYETNKIFFVRHCEYNNKISVDVNTDPITKIY